MSPELGAPENPEVRDAIRRWVMRQRYPLLAALLVDTEHVIQGLVPGGLLMLLGLFDDMERRERRRRRGKKVRRGR